MSGKVIKVLGRFGRRSVNSARGEAGSGGGDDGPGRTGTTGGGYTYGTYTCRPASSNTKHTDHSQINDSAPPTRKGQIAGEVYVPYVEGSPAVHIPDAPREVYEAYVEGEPALHIPDAGVEPYVPYVEGAPAPNMPNAGQEPYEAYVVRKGQSVPACGGADNVAGPTPPPPVFTEEGEGFLAGYYCSRPRPERLAMHRRGQALRREHPDWPGDACDLQAMEEHFATHPAEPPFEMTDDGAADRYLREGQS